MLCSRSEGKRNFNKLKRYQAMDEAVIYKCTHDDRHRFILFLIDINSKVYSFGLTLSFGKFIREFFGWNCFLTQEFWWIIGSFIGRDFRYLLTLLAQVNKCFQVQNLWLPKNCSNASTNLPFWTVFNRNIQKKNLNNLTEQSKMPFWNIESRMGWEG